MYEFSLVCTFKKAIELFQVKVDVRKGALRLKETFDNRCVSFTQYTFIHCCHMVEVLNDFLVHSC